MRIFVRSPLNLPMCYYYFSSFLFVIHDVLYTSDVTQSCHKQLKLLRSRSANIVRATSTPPTSYYSCQIVAQATQLNAVCSSSTTRLHERYQNVCGALQLLIVIRVHLSQCSNSLLSFFGSFNQADFLVWNRLQELTSLTQCVSRTCASTFLCLWE